MSDTNALTLGFPKVRILSTGAAPVVLAELTEVSVELSQELKELVNKKRVAVSHVITGQKLTGKAKALTVQPRAIALAIGGAVSTGSIVTIEDEALTFSGAGPYTATVAHAASFGRDLGLVTSEGVALTPVASNPGAGQYSVSAGVYTASTSLTGAKASYTYSDSVNGQTTTVTNVDQAEATSYALVGDVTMDGKTVHLEAGSIVFTKGGFGISSQNQSEPEIEFVGQCPTGQSTVYVLSVR